MKMFVVLVIFILLFKNIDAYSYETAAKQAILVDGKNGQILFEKNANNLMHPSSMTKIMTTYIAFQNLKSGRISLTDKYITSEKAWKMEGSRMFLNYGDVVSLDQVLKGIVVQSGNDACVVLAEGLNGDESSFVKNMNETAKKLGMTKTHFSNSSGLPDPANLSTAKDLSKLGIAMIETFPEYYHYHQIKNFEYGNIKQSNRNVLLGKIGIDGIKTGHTEAGGFGIVLSAIINNRRLIAVINGLPSDKIRAQEGEKIINYGFNVFQEIDLFKAKQVIGTTTVQYGRQPKIKFGLESDFQILAGNIQNNIECNIKYKDFMKAPIMVGDDVGIITCNIPNIYSDGISMKLVATENVNSANFTQKLWQNLEYVFALR
jgi:D-alanyl-D-alanine carboxypeptidase (penicillin-binding protein 5/6)